MFSTYPGNYPNTAADHHTLFPMPVRASACVNGITDMESMESQRVAFELCFESLVDPRRNQSFPCDAGGHVDMDSLEQHMLREYLYARTVIGREYRTPRVRARHGN